MTIALPSWAAGTAMGIIAGNILPTAAVSALSVALYGMFLAVIIPAAHTDKIVGSVVTASFLISFLVSKIPSLAAMSDSLKISLLTILISGISAFFFPVKEDPEESSLTDEDQEVTVR